jgi:hypothetical protein
LISNPSLEADASGDKVPDCWMFGSYGTNTPVYTRVSDAHTGSFAEMLQITAFTSGDRKLVTSQNDLTCAPGAKPGVTNTVSVWYKSDHPVALMAFYQDSAGVWHYWSESAGLASSPSWTKGTWTTPATPAGAVRLSVGLALESAGTVTMDDFGLVIN